MMQQEDPDDLKAMKRGVLLYQKAGFAADILELLASDHTPDCFAAFCGDGALYLTNGAFSSIQKISAVPSITSLNGQIKLYFQHPYVCITERFGVNGAVVHLQSGTVFPLCRAAYHEDVSSYSIAFFKRQNSTLLVHQSAWNRLEILDLQTGKSLTQPDGTAPLDAGRKEHDIDYFHSLLQASPGGTGILSNGWHWGPADNIKYATIDDFLKQFDSAFCGIDYANGYNWDRPCAFLDDETLVAAVDLDAEQLEAGTSPDGCYEQLWVYSLRRPKPAPQRFYEPVRKLRAALFPVNEYGEIAGELLFDREKNWLVALSADGAALVDTDGTVLKRLPQLCCPAQKAGSCEAWRYSTAFHFFYRLDKAGGKILTYSPEALFEENRQ